MRLLTSSEVEMRKKPTALELKVEALRKRVQAQRSNAVTNTKKKAKPVGYKMQNTFEKSLQGVPGGSMSKGVGPAIVKMIAAPHTGTRVRQEGIGVLRSARNANTTQGSYVRSTVHDEQGNVVSDAQGRKGFGL